MKELQIAVLTATLQKLSQPYAVHGDSLTITPTSSRLLDILPGDHIDVNGTVQLVIDLKEFDLVAWITRVVIQLKEKI